MFAELHLDLCPAFITVEEWAWHGAPSAKEVIAPLPDKKNSNYKLWLGGAMEAAEREGLIIGGGYEGEPWPTGRDYFPSPETVANLERIDKELDAVYGKASGY